MRLDQTSSDSQCSPTTNDEVSAKETESIEQMPSDKHADTMPPQVEATEKTFEEAGVFITENDIIVNVSTNTGLRKTGFSDNLYSDDMTSPKKSLTKIPRSPMARRRNSVDNCSVSSDLSTVTNLPTLARKSPVYRSVRQPSTGGISRVSPATSTKHIGTWSGRSTTKKRPTIGSDTFQTMGNINGSETNLNQKANSALQRNSETRVSHSQQYDKNGRRIKSLSTSPVKQSTSTSPLAQQILEAAESAKNDAQMLEKMKLLLKKYAPKSDGSPVRRASASPSPLKNKNDFEDFTTAWVNSNGSLDRASNCCTPIKSHSKRSSAASSIESTSFSKDVTVSSRRDRGASRIPAPIRQNTELY